MMELIASKEELENALSLFKGQRCWNVSSCVIDTSLYFRFGGALETLWYTAKGIPKRDFEGQFELLIFCSWRLDNEKHAPIACSARSTYDEIKATMVTLMDDTIDTILLYPPVWEATIRFLSGKSLRLFSNQIPAENCWHNWGCSTENNTYYVGAGQEISREEKRPNLLTGTVLTLDQVDFSNIPSDKDYVPSASSE